MSDDVGSMQPTQECLGGCVGKRANKQRHQPHQASELRTVTLGT